MYRQGSVLLGCHEEKFTDLCQAVNFSVFFFVICFRDFFREYFLDFSRDPFREYFRDFCP